MKFLSLYSNAFLARKVALRSYIPNGLHTHRTLTKFWGLIAILVFPSCGYDTRWGVFDSRSAGPLC